jgi:hypothetical protein
VIVFVVSSVDSMESGNARERACESR